MQEHTLSPTHLKLIQRLAQTGNLSVESLIEQWNSALAKQATFREHLLKLGAISEKVFQEAVSDIVKLPFVDRLPQLMPNFQNAFTQAVPIRFAKKYLFYPYEFDDEKLVFVVINPWPSVIYEEAARALKRQSFSLVVSTEKVILDTINLSYDRNSSSAEEAAEVLEDDADLAYLDHFSVDETEDLLDAEDEEPIKKLMNSILVQSVRDQSSDIHIDPSPKETIVRNRIDGVLHKITTVPKAGHIPLVNRVKVMAGLDISAKNKPQDGRTMIIHAGRKIDIRVSTIPTVHGEQAVLRLLNQSQGIIPLKELGMAEDIAEQMEVLVRQPHGIILVTGPTGSGKTTSLYSALNRINANEKNIVTIEDPVEYRINNYGQMQVNEKIGVTFAKGLRAMLRQDPDVIMIGEMRDTETAQIAIQASLTGHLVLSTIHTNEAAATVIRLIDMGIEPYLVTSTVTAVLAQRLVRKVCSHCKAPYSIGKDRLLKLGFSSQLLETHFAGTLWKGDGCHRCLQTGYQGRIGVFELLLMNDEIRKAINKSTDAAAVKQAALSTGMKGIKYDVCHKVLTGETTVEEMLRVVITESGKS
ncbi:MAG: Flp pilus assembly complex ATPase component TadA [Deltaproteobacteria bacterium]|nr:Flp pilus assembly complex ATPase component TadA [Deltaproteobacteria bacterium]